jgi:N-acetylglucosaminyldiphosphoundecaprenol N-acetyl-beta-D-mannosaminyltransferase
MEKIRVWDLAIDTISLSETIAIIETNITSRSLTTQISVNAAKIVNAQKDKLLKKAINDAHIVNVDGMSVVWALRILGYKIPERVPGIDLFESLLSMSMDKGYRPYFLGAKSDVINEMMSEINVKYSNLEIAGWHSGYFDDNQELDIANEVKASSADLLFLGITSPKKEMFINKYSEYMEVPFVMGVGGSFDIMAGRSRRAPKWIQNSGLEWLYRIYQEPRRMWKRYAITNTVFIWMLLKTIFDGNRYK